MRPNRLHERGITIMELMIAIGIIAIMVVPLSALVYQSTMARGSSQDSLYSQQEGAVVLSRFTQDVRASVQMTSPLAQSTSVTMRRPTSLNTFDYVTWRLQDGKLQRGESTSAAAAPSRWQDVIDPNVFTVQAGRFAYYTLNNGVPQSQDEARRLELRDIELHSKSTGSTLKPPAVSAVMREPAQTRAMSVEGDWETWGSDQKWQGTVHIRFRLRNHAGKALQVGAFAATWDDQRSGGYIKSMNLDTADRSTWGGGQSEYRSGDAPQTLDRPLDVAAEETITVELDVRPVEEFTSFTMTLYEATDTAHSRPYVLKVK